jgi:hypothetical protein
MRVDTIWFPLFPSAIFPSILLYGPSLHQCSDSQRLAQPAGIVTIGAPFAGPASVKEKMIIGNEKVRFDRGSRLSIQYQESP